MAAILDYSLSQQTNVFKRTTQILLAYTLFILFSRFEDDIMIIHYSHLGGKKLKVSRKKQFGSKWTMNAIHKLMVKAYLSHWKLQYS